jgi:hypothetical protein
MRKSHRKLSRRVAAKLWTVPPPRKKSRRNRSRKSLGQSRVSRRNPGPLQELRSERADAVAVVAGEEAGVDGSKP